MQHEHPNPSTREPVEAGPDAEHSRQPFLRPLREEDDLTRWKRATLQEKGEAMRGLLRFVEKVGRFPPKRDQFPGFPRSLWIRNQQEQ